MTPKTTLRWHNPDWVKQAHEWIRTQAERNSLKLTGEIEQNHAYAWSTVMRVPTDKGIFFFKATAPQTRYEILLTQKLSEWNPDCLPELIAIEPSHGWMLMRDGGEQLRASIRPTKNISPWLPVIIRYAELQIGLVKFIPEILALGAPDHRPAALPALYSQLLADEPSLMIGQEKGLTSAEFQQLQNLTPRFQQICADLAALGIPDSVNHGDFHDGNILLKKGRLTFFDWGDASIAHPFVSLRNWFVSMEIALELEDWAPPTPEMSEMLSRYLEAWQAYGEKEALMSAYHLSKPVASISKALAWRQALFGLDDSLREEYAWIVPNLLNEFMVYEKML
ncbi:MAG: phosphotransferase [Anaerolineales bacterium]|nr:MAG: phosphotransferase [Anaerolineales bacterium]